MFKDDANVLRKKSEEVPKFGILFTKIIIKALR